LPPSQNRWLDCIPASIHDVYFKIFRSMNRSFPTFALQAYIFAKATMHRSVGRRLCLLSEVLTKESSRWQF